MQVRKALPIAGAAALLGLLLGSTVFGPGAATAQENDTGIQEESTTSSDRWLEILQPLVEEGVISDEQASAVASHLAETVQGRRGHFVGRGPGLASFAAAAETLGIETWELREAMAAGSTLAEVAEAHGVELETLVNGLLAVLEAKLDEAVEAGKLTEERAADILASAPDRIENFINSEVRIRRGFWLTPGDRPEA